MTPPESALGLRPGCRTCRCETESEESMLPAMASAALGQAFKELRTKRIEQHLLHRIDASIF